MYFCDNYIGRKCTFSDRKEYFQNSEALKWCLSEHVRNNVNYKILYLQKYPDLQEVFFSIILELKWCKLTQSVLRDTGKTSQAQLSRGRYVN